MIARAFGLAALIVLHSNIKCCHLIAAVILFLILSVLSRKDVIPTLGHFLGSRFQGKSEVDALSDLDFVQEGRTFIGHFLG